MVSEDDELRSQIRILLAELESLIQRTRQVHAGIPIPERDDLMLVGEEEPSFAHIVRVVLECALGDHLNSLLRDLRKLLEQGGPGDRPA